MHADGRAGGHDGHMRIEFNSSPGPSLGVEVELELVDRDTRELTSAATAILAAVAGEGEPHPKMKHELFECTIEIITDVCHTAAEARADLATTLAELRAVTDLRNIELLCSGTHPFSNWADQVISPNPRYRVLVEQMAWMAQRLQIFGVHVHVGVRSPAKAVAIANALSGYIPHLLALSASSPYWVGHDTGLASCRSKVFEGLPTAGLPEQLVSWDEFEHLMETLVSAQAIETIREVWWDIRPHPGFGTIELRMFDGLPSLDDVAAVAALGQSLVAWCDERLDRGEDLGIPHEWLVRQNKWRAARHGLDAELIVGDDGSRLPLRTMIADLLVDLAPAAERLACTSELQGVERMLDRGSSSERQRAVVRDGGTLVDVVDALVAELRQ